MFRPRVAKAAQLYKINVPMTAGTVVGVDANGLLVPAANGVGAIGFLAANVRDWSTRTEGELLFPELFFGFMESLEFINQPGVTSPKLVGVRIGAGYEYEVSLNETLNPGDELVADANGQLVKKPVGDSRDSLAVVKSAGTEVGLPLNNTQKVHIIRTLI